MSEKIDKKEKITDDTFSITMELQRPLFIDEVDENDDNNKKKYNIKKNLLVAISVVALTVIIGFIIWINKTYSAEDIAKAALVSNENVEVRINDYISFTPKNLNPTKGFILYPGAKVESQAYAELAMKISENGYQVIILDVPLNIALLGQNEAQKAMNDYSNISNWVVGGHSLGGVAASNFAIKNNMVDGVVLLASYPMNDKLKNIGIDVMSIYGSKDGVVNFKELIKSKDKLPEDTTYVEIEGANHSQFGDYGLQKGDNEALITSEEQMDKTYKSIVKFIENIN